MYPAAVLPLPQRMSTFIGYKLDDAIQPVELCTASLLAEPAHCD
jgi:hypothetical protein